MKMNPESIRNLLTEVLQGDRTIDEALDMLRILPYEDLGFAQLDHHRSLRTGIPEVIFGQGKSPPQILTIVEKFVANNERVIATRINTDAVALLKDKFPNVISYELARMVSVGEFPAPAEEPFVIIASAGTSDMPVAEEASVTLELLGTRAVRLYDVGVAGIHRLLDRLDLLNQAEVVIAVAGMEGALASVIGGLVSCPVIAVPTSVGYGANFQGIASLLTMLNSCVPGIAVVNIDNGFGAASISHKIARKRYPQVT